MIQIPMLHNAKGAHIAPDYRSPGHPAPSRPAHGIRAMSTSKMVPPNQAGPSQVYHPGYSPTVGMYRTARGSAASTMQGHYGHPHPYPTGGSPAYVWLSVFAMIVPRSYFHLMRIALMV